MSSVVDYKKCPRCGGVMYYEFNCRTGEEYGICDRCGANYGFEEDNESFGRCYIQFNNGVGRSFSLAEPVNDKVKSWYEEQIKREDVDPDKSYLMAWDTVKKEIVVVYGNDPGSYDDSFATEDIS